MNFLVTAGSAQAHIDRVRCVTSGFTGRTGAAIARTAWGRGHSVTLVTSRPDSLLEYGVNPRDPGERFTVVPFRTYDELAVALPARIKADGYDAVCHTASGGDFLPAGSFIPDPGTFFNARTGQWEGKGGPPAMTEQKGAKLSRGEPEVWLRLVRGPRLVERFRNPWGFGGVLVRFLMESGLGDSDLVAAAEDARKAAGADLMVTTTLEAAAQVAFLGPVSDRYDRVPRRELPDRLVLAVELVYQERIGHG